MSNPNALFLLADHIKLSLLERQQAKKLHLNSEERDSGIERSLDQLKDGLEDLGREQKRFEDAGAILKATTLADSLSDLEKQYEDLVSQFHGFAFRVNNQTLTPPNNDSLASEFIQASSTVSEARQMVRFSDNQSVANLEAQRNRKKLLPYTDDPDAPEGYRDIASNMESNGKIHAYHQLILAEQDEQLDRLGESISRQRELSMQIGDELDEQVLMLDESERHVERQQSRLDRTRNRIGKFARSASGENRQMTVIVVLIFILVLLIVILK